MQTQRIFELVFSSGVEVALRQTGEIDPLWRDSFVLEIQKSDLAPIDDLTWPKQYFQALHYVSMHLGLSYRSWTVLERGKNEETAQTLADLQFTTEAHLWSSLNSLTSTAAVSASHYADLISLCFGDNAPLKIVDLTTSFRPWKDEYERCLKQCAQQFKHSEIWPKSLCMAIHFASFYIDWFQSRCVDLRQTTVDNSQHANRIQEIVDHLGGFIKNESVLHLIRLWLCSCQFKRDAGGVPEIGAHRPRTGQFVSVRTMSELFLIPDAMA
jgi:hypothetical protein